MNCLLCDAPLIEVHRIENFPTYMGTIDNIVVKGDYPCAPLIFCVCEQCRQFQVGKRLPLETLYPMNHNADIVGDIWREHYATFKDFAIYCGIRGRVVEIGDASGKLAKIMHYRADEWEIIEPNPAIKDFGNVSFREEFFDSNTKVEPCDYIVHSHTFEHQYDPVAFLKACKSALRPNGKMIFTVPNMYSIACRSVYIATILNFEHIFYMDEMTIRWLCAVSGLKIDKLEWFRDHSIFVCCSPGGESPPDLLTHNIKRESMLRNNLRSGNVNAKNIADQISKTDRAVFLFGAHVTTQYLLFSGVPQRRIEGLLDNGPSKVGNWLSGTDLKVFSPDNIAGRKVAVVTSHSGAYRQEIEKQLIAINSDVLLL